MPTDALSSLPAISATTFANVVIFALLAHYFIERWLLQRHIRHVAAYRDEVPAPFADRIALDDPLFQFLSIEAAHYGFEIETVDHGAGRV